MIQKDDVDDVVNNNQQLIQSPTVPAQFTVEAYDPFTDYLGLKYSTYEESENNKQKELDYVFRIGIEKAKEKLEFEMYPILFEGKKPREDVMNKLVRIAKEFQSHRDYPILKSMAITNTVNKILDSKDKRTKKKYHKCIQTYIGSVKELGNTNVSGFIDRIPKEYLNTTSSSTSLQECGVG